MKLVANTGQNAGANEFFVDDLKNKLRAQTGPDAVAECLSAAAALVEHAAYEMAQNRTSTHVAQMILLAADLERTAQGFDRATCA